MDRPIGNEATARATIQAAEWLLELEAPDVSEERIAAWQRWLAQSAQHRRAFDRIQAVQEHIEEVPNLPWPSADELASDHYDGSRPLAEYAREEAQEGPLGRPSRRLTVWMEVLGAVSALAASLVLVSWIRLPTLVRPTVLETSVGELRRVHLRDESTVTVDADSRVTVDLEKATRSITLERGEAFFEVSKDPRRPFIVHVGETSIRAIGTAFNVRRAGDDVTVAVAEGVVEVSRPPSATVSNSLRGASKASIERISAGHQVRIAPTELDTPVAMQADSVAAWRDGRRQYVGEPLANVVADLRRYSRRKIVIEDQGAGELTVSGAVFENNIDLWLHSLEAALPVQVQETADGTVSIRARSQN